MDFAAGGLVDLQDFFQVLQLQAGAVVALNADAFDQGAGIIAVGLFFSVLGIEFLDHGGNGDGLVRQFLVVKVVVKELGIGGIFAGKDKGVVDVIPAVAAVGVSLVPTSGTLDGQVTVTQGIAPISRILRIVPHGLVDDIPSIKRGLSIISPLLEVTGHGTDVGFQQGSGFFIGGHLVAGGKGPVGGLVVPSQSMSDLVEIITQGVQHVVNAGGGLEFTVGVVPNNIRFGIVFRSQGVIVLLNELPLGVVRRGDVAGADRTANVEHAVIDIFDTLYDIFNQFDTVLVHGCSSVMDYD